MLLFKIDSGAYLNLKQSCTYAVLFFMCHWCIYGDLDKWLHENLPNGDTQKHRVYRIWMRCINEWHLNRNVYVNLVTRNTWRSVLKNWGQDMRARIWGISVSLVSKMRDMSYGFICSLFLFFKFSYVISKPCWHFVSNMKSRHHILAHVFKYQIILNNK